MGETFDITFLVSSEKIFSIQEFEKICSDYFKTNIVANKKNNYSKECFLNGNSQILVNHYFETGYLYNEFIISFSEFNFNNVKIENHNNEFYKMTNSILGLIDADIAVCSYEINSLNLEKLYSIDEVIKKMNDFHLSL